ncbi:MAG: cobalamin-dependent protein [Chloroflexi bacterium]|nr:cobalamin-dependent protein [Chloroflexota bacterium]MBV9134425.1 cobalamin-dependent protein [Chloroflexota bacterium]
MKKRKSPNVSTQQDLVIVNPGSRQEIYQALGRELTAIEPPLWAGMLATFARNRGYSVSIIDAEAENLSPTAVGERVASINPRLLAVVVYGHQPSASTQNMTAAGQICRESKRLASDTPTLLIGGHVSALPERTLREEGSDFVCQGEGAHTIAVLLEHLKASGPALSDVPGLWYLAGGRVQANMPAPIIADLDTDLPGVAWDLLPMERYRAHNWHCFNTSLNRQPYASIYTTLGCPYKCTFCCINAPFRLTPDRPNSYRFRGATRVLDELQLLQEKYGVRNLKIADEMFVLNEKHVFAICDGIVERGLDFNIWAYARVDTVKDHFLDKLKAAGVNWLALGIESASKHVRDGVEKGRFGSEQIIEVVRKIEAAEINIIGNYIFGLPDDDQSSMQETLDLALELRTDFGNFYSAMAYPGSKLYEMAVQQGWRLPPTWNGFSQHAVDTLPLPTEHVSASEVLRFRDHAFQVYFNDPAYLAKVTARFGASTADHVREMAAVPLERRFADEAAVEALGTPQQLDGRMAA